MAGFSKDQKQIHLQVQTCLQGCPCMMVNQHVITGIDLRPCGSNGLGKTLYFNRPLYSSVS